MSLAATTRSHKHVLTPWSKQGAVGGPTFVRGEGSFIYDDTGKRYLDLSAGLVSTNLGHGHPAVVKAIQEQVAKVAYVPPSLMNDTRSEFAELLSDISPWEEGARTFFGTAGGQANEDAVAMSRMITGRSKVLTAYRSFHGSAPGAGNLTGEDRRWAHEPGMPGVVHFFAPYPYRSPFFTDDPAVETKRALEHLEQVITFEGPKKIAALLLEPVVGSNGVIVYPEGYLEGVRAMTEKYGIVLIFDEVMTGFGRVGDTFAATRFGVKPDMITFAKGSSSAYIPLGGVLMREGLRPVDPLQWDIDASWIGAEQVLAALGDIPGLVRQPVPQERRVSFYVNTPEAQDLAAERLANLPVDLLRSADKYLDVLPQGVNKGSTLTKLVQHLGVDPGNVLVAGDTLNDLSLYHTGYRGVVVGQAEAGLSEATAGMDNVHHARSPGAGGILEAIKLDGVPDLRPVPAKVPTGDAQLVVVYHRLPEDLVPQFEIVLVSGIWKEPLRHRRPAQGHRWGRQLRGKASPAVGSIPKCRMNRSTLAANAFSKSWRSSGPRIPK